MQWNEHVSEALFRMGPLPMNATWNGAMNDEMKRLHEMGAFLPSAAATVFSHNGDVCLIGWHFYI
jgi:hypothetical protein